MDKRYQPPHPLELMLFRGSVKRLYEYATLPSIQQVNHLDLVFGNDSSHIVARDEFCYVERLVISADGSSKALNNIGPVQLVG